MNPHTGTKQKIVSYLTSQQGLTLKHLIETFGISKQAMSKHLRELIAENKVYKQGTPPKVFYFAQTKIDSTKKTHPDIDEDSVSDFGIITASGKHLKGIEAFIYWCEKRGYDIKKMNKEYSKVKSKYTKYSSGFIIATQKLELFKDEVGLNNLFYGSFSSIEVFGKTYPYQLMLYAKQSQDIHLMRQLLHLFKTQVIQLIEKNNYDAIGFIPPTVKRKVQFMDSVAEYLDINLPHVKITKIQTPVVVPQKTLSKPSDRIQNAKDTFVVEDMRKFSNILLIDDFAGSGSTLNYIAQKIRNRNPEIDMNIDGYVFAGSPNGVVNSKYTKYEVVNEV